MSQSKDEIEQFYSRPDPWEYLTTSDDICRKMYITHMLGLFAHASGYFQRAIDLGAGEGWITRDMPAHKRYAYEISDNAAKRLPYGVTRVETLVGKYDLMLATGVLYPHYDWAPLVEMIRQHASGIILTCHIEPWEQQHIIEQIPGRPVLELRFPYRSWHQKMRVFDVRA